MTSKIAIIGDSHGNAPFLNNVFGHLKNHGVQLAIVAGDFGLWTHFLDGQQFLDQVNESAKKNNLSVIAVGGNHENWDHWNWYVENNPTAHRNAYVRERVLLAPRINSWKYNGKNIFVLGGAVSIDKASRIQAENSPRGKGPRTLYWPNEVITEEHILSVEKYAGPQIDYFISHDCSNRTPFYGRLKPDTDSEQSRLKIDRALKHLAPKLHFHGHMHTRYDWMNLAGEKNGEAVYVQTYGLECDGMWNNWGILDTDTDEFFWRGEDSYEPTSDPFELRERAVQELHARPKPAPVAEPVDDNF